MLKNYWMQQKKNGIKPKIIFVSTTYVYDQNAKNEIFTELDFSPLNHKASILERSAETYFSRNLIKEDLYILLFPIILRRNDYTLRTDFFNIGGSLNQIKSAAPSNFIFIKDIVRVVKSIENFKLGIFNVVKPECLDQRDLAKFYKIVPFKDSFISRLNSIILN